MCCVDTNIQHKTLLDTRTRGVILLLSILKLKNESTKVKSDPLTTPSNVYSFKAEGNEILLITSRTSGKRLQNQKNTIWPKSIP